MIQTAQVEIRRLTLLLGELSLIKEAFKFVWAHINVTKNAP